MPKTILYIHQSAELYGSDKALQFLVEQINMSSDFNAIVVLPNDGPLKTLLEKSDVKVIIYPVLKVSRSFFKIKNILRLPSEIYRTTKGLKKLLGNQKIDIVHSNTLAVLLGAFYAKRYKIKHIWHVHEIIKKPKIVKIAYPLIVNWYSTKVVYNSKASKEFLCENNQSLSKKSIINLNGMDRIEDIASELTIEKIRTELFKVKPNEIVLALVGRISKWKGQGLLLESFAELTGKHNDVKLVFIGSTPPNQDYLKEELQSQIDKFNLNDLCNIIPFQNNIWNIWDSIDIAIVPSTEPEPFGLVALEAMLAKKPVIGANHGGLREIISNNETGYFFRPNNSEDLSHKIEDLITSRDRITEFGNKGYQKAVKDFSLQRHVDNFIEIYNDIFN